MCGKINKRIASFLLGAVMCINSGAALAEITNVDADASITASKVNFRLGPGTDYQAIGRFNRGDSVRVIFNDGDWDFISCNGQLGYVSHEFLTQTYGNVLPEHCYVEDKDVVVTTDVLNYRSQPVKSNETKLGTLPSGYEIETIAQVDDQWYLVRYDGQFVYISKEFTRSLRSAVQSYYPDAENIEIFCMGAVKRDTSFTTSTGRTVAISYPHVVNILRQENDYYLISYDGSVGYVAKRDIEKLKGRFVVVDKSDQRFNFYCNTQMLINSKASTGKRGYETPEGMWYIDTAERDRTFTKAGVTVDYAFHYDGNYFAHTYNQPESDFGKPQSHGCTRIPTATGARFYDYMDSNHDGVIDNKVRIIIQK